MPQPPSKPVTPVETTTRPDTTSFATLINDAEALQTALRDLLGKTKTLIIGLKRQRQQTRLMRTALQSLRAVQTIDV